MRRRIKEDLKEHRITIIMLLFLAGVSVGAYFGISNIMESQRQEKRIDRETAFITDGIVTGTRTVYSPRKGLIGDMGTDETLYLIVNDQEYEISSYMLEKTIKGDHVKVSGKRGTIEGLEIIR